MIVDPWGTVVAYVLPVSNSEAEVLTYVICHSQCPQNTPSTGALCFAEVDLEWAGKIRREMPMGW